MTEQIMETCNSRFNEKAFSDTCKPIKKSSKNVGDFDYLFKGEIDKIREEDNSMEPIVLHEHWREYSKKEINQMEHQCAKCKYSSGVADKEVERFNETDNKFQIHTTCNYLLRTGKRRGCRPEECVSKGRFVAVVSAKDKPVSKFSPVPGKDKIQAEIDAYYSSGRVWDVKLRGQK